MVPSPLVLFFLSSAAPAAALSSSNFLSQSQGSLGGRSLGGSGHLYQQPGATTQASPLFDGRRTTAGQHQQLGVTLSTTRRPLENVVGVRSPTTPDARTPGGASPPAGRTVQRHQRGADRVPILHHHAGGPRRDNIVSTGDGPRRTTGVITSTSSGSEGEEDEEEVVRTVRQRCADCDCPCAKYSRRGLLLCCCVSTAIVVGGCAAVVKFFTSLAPCKQLTALEQLVVHRSGTSSRGQQHNKNRSNKVPLPDWTGGSCWNQECNAWRHAHCACSLDVNEVPFPQQCVCSPGWQSDSQGSCLAPGSEEFKTVFQAEHSNLSLSKLTAGSCAYAVCDPSHGDTVCADGANPVWFNYYPKQIGLKLTKWVKGKTADNGGTTQARCKCAKPDEYASKVDDYMVCNTSSGWQQTLARKVAEAKAKALADKKALEKEKKEWMDGCIGLMDVCAPLVDKCCDTWSDSLGGPCARFNKYDMIYKCMAGGQWRRRLEDIEDAGAGGEAETADEERRRVLLLGDQHEQDNETKTVAKYDEGRGAASSTSAQTHKNGGEQSVSGSSRVGRSRGISLPSSRRSSTTEVVKD